MRSRFSFTCRAGLQRFTFDPLVHSREALEPTRGGHWDTQVTFWCDKRRAAV